MAMEYDGKKYRNLQEQVAYLTTKWQQLADEIEEVRAQIPSKMIVEELPEEGDPLITYYVGPKGTAPNQYYEVWIWVQEEEDGPFVWRELEDTDQVDLSGYLPIQDGTTTLPQVYGKTEAGEQVMVNMDINATALTIPFRDANGRTKVAAPDADGDAANKKYVVDNFLAKQTGTTTYPQAYVKDIDGTQVAFNIVKDGYDVNSLVRRTGGGQVVCAAPEGSNDAVNLNYANGQYLPKQTATSIYPQVYVKYSTGNQGMINYHDTVVNGSLVLRTNTGQIPVPTTPTDNSHAASKAYVDAAVGQLIYHHRMTITYAISATDFIKIAAHIDSNYSTPYTAISWNNMPIIEADYAVLHLVGDDYMCAVSKLPYGLHQDDFGEPWDGFMYIYWNGSAFVSGRANSNLYGTPTVTDVVTTW